jgi:hypothetical protein
LTQSRTDPPVTANRAERRSAGKRRFPLALVIVPVVLVAAGVLVILALQGNGAGGIIGTITGGNHEDDTVPPFDFTQAKTGVVATTENADADAMATQAESVTADITPMLDDLYTNAFLDPTKWRAGDYEEIFGIFAPDALADAQAGIETLTLGATAGDVYERVTPKRGTIKYRVLFDQDGNPATVVATVTFSALGQRQDGTYTAIVSSGEYFFSDEGGWKVTAFTVSRADHETKAPPSPTPSASGSGSTGATGAS